MHVSRVHLHSTFKHTQHTHTHTHTYPHTHTHTHTAVNRDRHTYQTPEVRQSTLFAELTDVLIPLTLASLLSFLSLACASQGREHRERDSVEVSSRLQECTRERVKDSPNCLYIVHVLDNWLFRNLKNTRACTCISDIIFRLLWMGVSSWAIWGFRRV